MLTLYRGLAGLAAAAAWPALRRRAARDPAWRERLALPGALPPPGASPPVWIHAASVGEMQAALPLAEESRSRRPAIPIVVSAMTATGRRSARETAPWAPCFQFPLDAPRIARRALAQVRPRGVLITETELWPSFLSEAARAGTPVALVNGRISPAGFGRYRRVRALTAPLLAALRLLVMQTEADAERVRALGAPPERVRVGGNVKADAVASPLSAEERRRARAGWGLEPDAPLLVAGSVRPLEAAVVLDGWLGARVARGRAQLLIAPRHLDAVAGLESELAARGLRWRRRSGGAAGAERAGAGAAEALEPPPVLLLDTMGELAEGYAMGDAAFVGGTLHAKYGGHNPLEPASRGVPVLFGPHTRNCAEAAASLLARGGAREVRDAAEFASVLAGWLADETARARAARGALEAASALRGTASRTLDLLEEAGFPW